MTEFIATPGLMRIAYNELSRQLFDLVSSSGFQDLRPSHGNVMEQLSYDDGLPMKDLARRAGMTAQSIGELVDDLTRMDYLERRPDPADRRVKRVHLTAKGRRNTRVAGKAVAEVERDLVETLGEARYRRLRRDLETVVEAYSTGESV